MNSFFMNEINQEELKAKASYLLFLCIAVSFLKSIQYQGRVYSFLPMKMTSNVKNDLQRLKSRHYLCLLGKINTCIVFYV